MKLRCISDKKRRFRATKGDKFQVVKATNGDKFVVAFCRFYFPSPHFSQTISLGDGVMLPNSFLRLECRHF